MRIVGLEQDVVGRDAVEQMGRRVLLEEITAVDLAREILATA